MSQRQGVVSRIRYRVKVGRDKPYLLDYVTDVLLQDPCVYCGLFGCDTIDHITPKSKADTLTTGFGLWHWTNFAPCHRRCNMVRSSKGVLLGLVATKKDGDHGEHRGSDATVDLGGGDVGTG